MYHRSVSKRNHLTEAHIQQACSSYLELDGWRALRTDPTSDRARGKGFGEVGMADHLYIRYLTNWRMLLDNGHRVTLPAGYGFAQIIWVEYKSASGKLKPAQLQWAAAERARGAMVWLATRDFPPTIEGFQNFYRASGLARNVR